MNYIVNNIESILKNNLPNSGEEAIFRINGFDDLRIYENVAQDLSNECKQKNLSIDIKLAKTRWHYFDKTCNDTNVKNRMLSNGWVAEAESVTFYRNLHNKDVLILMGTEAEEDKGGLMNCFTITPQTLVDNLKEKYSSMFTITYYNKEDLEKINTLYKNLFKCCAFDICKLSHMIELHAAPFYDMSDFIAWFDSKLVEWGMPVILADRNNGRIEQISKLLDSAKKFISRTNNSIFGATTSTYKKLVAKIDAYKNKGGQYLNYKNWPTGSVKDFNELEKVILEFAFGTNIEANRNILLNTPYEIIADIVGTNIGGKGVPSGSIETINGDPLKVIIESMIKRMIAAKDFDIDFISKIEYEFDEIELITPSSEDDYSNELLNAWLPFTYYAGGIFDFINGKDWKYNGQDVEVVVNDPELFLPSNAYNNVYDDGSSNCIVKKAGPSKKLNSAKFIVKCYDENDKLISKLNKEYSWKFSNDEGWINYFRDFQEINSKGISEYVPIGLSDNIEKLIFSNSNEEFFDRYDKCIGSFDCDLLNNLFTSRVSSSTANIAAKYDDLAKTFGDLVNEVTTNGFFDEVGLKSLTLNKLFNDYVEMGKMISSTNLAFTDNWILLSYIFAFTILKDTGIIDKDVACSSCVVTPWHPATLQKISNQKIFFLDGCSYWWEKVEDNKAARTIKALDNKINTLNQMSVIENGVDVFKHDQEYFGVKNCFGGYSTYCLDKYSDVKLRLDDIIQKDAVFEDDFANKVLEEFNDDARMIYEIIEKYAESFTYYSDNLDLTFVYPKNLQPIVAALSQYIVNFRKKSSDNLSVNLNILVDSKNKGGKNYLEYWMNNYFTNDEFEGVKIRTFLNEVTDLDKIASTDDIINYVPEKTDIVFLLDFLSFTGIQFDLNQTKVRSASDCMFPIVYKPIAATSQSVKRYIEISQPQFPASYQHTQVVRAGGVATNDDFNAIKEVKLKPLSIKVVEELHDKSNWVVCIDQGMDGALLEASSNTKTYEVIGYSTGKGAYGQFNYTITAKPEIIESLRRKLARRLALLFKWDPVKIDKTVKLCINEAGKLDGISLFSAVNLNNYNINEFLAYVLTSILVTKDDQAIPNANKSPLKTIIHLDSYKHWFTNDDVTAVVGSNTRPDFLVVEVVNDPDPDLIKLKAKVIECKISTVKNSNGHIDKGTGQVEYGITKLKELFDPNSKDVTKRYWFAQLYRALIFSGITFQNNSSFINTTQKLRLILDGQFEIEWDGELYGYWIDSNNSNITNSVVNNIPVRNIPQVVIQDLLTQDGNSIYVNNNYDDILEGNPEEVSNEDIANSLEDEELDSDDETNSPYISGNDYNPKTSNDDDGNNEVTSNSPIDEETSSEPIEENQDDNQNSVQNNGSNGSSNFVSLEDTRVLIGKSDIRGDIYWEFGNKTLENRHCLITGTSGQGKTYCIQTMLYELAKSNVSSILFDYTEGFRKDQLDPVFTSKMGSKIEQRIVYAEGLSLNPFKRHEIDIAGSKMLEKTTDVANRIANILSDEYDFKEQQYSAIYSAVINGLKKYPDNMDFTKLINELENMSKNASAKSVVSKIRPFVDGVTFNVVDSIDWGDIIYAKESKTYIFQLSGYSKDIQLIITEMLLWDLWNYASKYGNKDKPFVVVLDEAQNLSHTKNSPSAKILTEGRKFGWSAWFATQSLDILKQEEITRLNQAGCKIYFRPAPNEMTKMDRMLASTCTNAGSNMLQKLSRGKCVVVTQQSGQNNSSNTQAISVNVTAFEDR